MVKKINRNFTEDEQSKLRRESRTEDSGYESKSVFRRKEIQNAAKGPPELDGVPKGYDPKIWHLALLFSQKSESRRVTLASGLPIAYAKLNQRIVSEKIELDVVEDMINYFWDEVVECDVEFKPSAYSLDEFLSLQTWDECRQQILMFRQISEVTSSYSGWTKEPNLERRENVPRKLSKIPLVKKTPEELKIRREEWKSKRKND